MSVADRPDVRVSASLEDPSRPVIRLAGELDLASVEATRAGIANYLTTAPTRVTFDLEELTFHGLRHAAATAWVAAGIDLRTAQHRLGHATPRLVLELYAYATSEADRAAPDLMGARLFGNGDALGARRAP